VASQTVGKKAVWATSYWQVSAAWAVGCRRSTEGSADDECSLGSLLSKDVPQGALTPAGDELVVWMWSVVLCHSTWWNPVGSIVLSMSVVK